MVSSARDNSDRDEWPPKTDEEVARLLRDFFADEMPADLRDGREREVFSVQEARPARRRVGLAAGLASVAVAACVMAILGWWMSNPNDSPTPRVVDRDPVAKSVVANDSEPPPVEAARPRSRESTARHVTTHLEPLKERSSRVAVEWTRLAVVDADSGTRLEFELATELRIHRQSPARGDRPEASVAAAYQYRETSDDVARSAGPVVAPRLTRRTILGVFTAPPGPLSRRQAFAPIGGAGGLAVLDVLPGSPAEAAGLRRNDILVAFEGIALESTGQLASLVARRDAGERVRLDVAGPRGFRAVSASLIAASFATDWNAPRAWRLPAGASVRGRDVLELTREGWPASVVRSQANPRPDWHGFKRVTSTTDAGGRPLLRIRWASHAVEPILAITLAWERNSGDWTVRRGRVPMRRDPREGLAWLLEEPALQSAVATMPRADRDAIRSELRLMSFPPARRIVRGVL